MADIKIAIIENGRPDTPSSGDNYTANGKHIDGIPHVPNPADWVDPLKENRAASVKTVMDITSGGGSDWKEEYIEITALMEIKGYVTLDLPFNHRKNIFVEIPGGSLQINKENLGPKAPTQLPQFEGDNILKDRVYFKSVIADDFGEGNEAHNSINGNYTTGELLRIFYRVS